MSAQPTQAQIEANQIRSLTGVIFEEQDKGVWAVTQDDMTKILAALTAAQVGEQQPKIVATLTPGMLALIEKDRAATIERCAQVVEQIGARYHAGRDVAAAIRKLKDAP